MHLPSNSQSIIALTPNKLNFIISQSKKQSNYQQPIRLDHDLSLQFIKNDNSSKQRKSNNQSIGTQTNFYVNQNSSKIAKNKKNVQVYDDSLDQLVTNREQQSVFRNNEERNTYQGRASVHQTERIARFTSDKKQNNIHIYSPFKQLNQSNYEQQNTFNQNKSLDLQNLSPKKVLKQKQDLQYFEHHRQNSPMKKVQWNLQPLTLQENRRYRINIEDSFRDISRELSKITYELNSNSKKMEEMKKFYTPAKKKLSPQECLKRANLKFSNNKNKQNLQCSIRRRPQIQYQDKIYRDPRYLIWQPQH